MPNDELHIKTLTFSEIGSTPQVKEIRFNLPRGSVARVLGFQWSWRDVNQQTGSIFTFSLHILPSKDSPVLANPTKALLVDFLEFNRITVVGTQWHSFTHSFNLPKPFRTTSLKAVAVGGITTSLMDLLINIYYDTDKAREGEAIQILEGKTNRSYRGVPAR